MERQFNNGDFEKLLRDNANQYRMYPSEKVWKGVHSALHTRRRWYGLTASIMFLVTSSIVSFIIFNDKPGKNNLAGQKNISTQSEGQKQVAAASSKGTKRFTPAINEIKPADHPPVNPTELYSNGPVFSIPSGTNEQSSVNFNNLSAIINGVRTIEWISADNSEMINEVPFFSGPDLLKHNSPVNTEIAVSDFVPEEKTITDQSLLNGITEKQIADAASALASQNILLAAPKKGSKITAQVYFTPIVSYRKLTENKKIYSGSGFYVPVIDVNNLVKHKPAMGLEFGIEGRYQVSKRLSLKTGLQFNINRYDIRAYSHPTEIATVALTSGYRVDSLATLSNYRNFSGTSPNWLENFYFQVAIPVGAEIIISDKPNFQWGISGTIQPTYMIGDRAYVISSDYKNYAKFPDLMRRWNISSSIGSFVSYSTGRIKWQAGPQVRYQHLSSFVSELSVKENLFAIGLKVGATLNNKK